MVRNTIYRLVLSLGGGYPHCVFCGNVLSQCKCG